MALWAKIQTLNLDCQTNILSLYNQDHPDFKFPIELRNVFAEAIENSVCGNNPSSVDEGLNPQNPQHKESIINFLDSLAGLLEERLKNSQSGDQFFTRHKLSEALTKLHEKKHSDPLGLFEFIRSRIQAELTLVSQQETMCSKSIPLERDVIMESLQSVKTQAVLSASALKEIKANEEQFALNCNKKQEWEAFLNPEQLKLYNEQNPGFEARVRENLSVLEECLQQNIRNLQILMQRFEQITTNNLNVLAALQGQIVNEKIAIWKHEQQRMANLTNTMNHSTNLDKLQIWCEELAELIWKHYLQLKEAEGILQNGVMQTGNANDLAYVQNRTEEVISLLQELLNHSLIVKEQPPQIIKMKTKFPKAVVVSLLVGKRLNIHMDRPNLSTFIISEDQANNLSVTNELETMGDITNGQQLMECKDDSDRLSATFRSMQLRSIKRTDKRGNVATERVMEEKSCLYFVFTATVGTLRFKVSTISLPVVVISHGSQEALAVASISWDNAFGEIGRTPFKVPNIAPWSEVAQILNAKFVEVAGRGLTEENLACLAQKAFRNRRPQPETIAWSELCKEHLPGRNFTFWTWFHAALKLIEKKETHLKELWKAGLITGFIDREYAEQLISCCEPGTFLLRFADSLVGAITIAVLVKPGAVVSLNPYQFLDLQSSRLALQIKDIQHIKYLYQRPHCIPKDEAFGKFYEKEAPQAQGMTGSNGKPYVALIPTISSDGSDLPSGSATPQPTYDGSHRYSISELSPIPTDQLRSPSPLFPPSPLPLPSFHDLQTKSSNNNQNQNHPSTLSFRNSLENSQCSQSVFPPPSVTTPLTPFNCTASELDTPLPPPLNSSESFFQFSNVSASNSEMFDDLIRVIGSDAGDAMEI